MLADFQRRYKFSGWVSGKDVIDTTAIIEENRTLFRENKNLTAKLAKISNGMSLGEEYAQIKQVLENIKISLPKGVTGKSGEKSNSLLSLFISNKDTLAVGVSNRAGTSDGETFLFYKVATKLMTFGLTEKVKVTGKVFWDKIQTSKAGHEFLKMYSIEKAAATKESS